MHVRARNGEERLECELHVDRICCLEHVSEFKYLRCVLDESGTDGAECGRKVASRRRVAGAIRFLVNAKDLQLQCARFLLETYMYVCMGVRQYHGKRRRDLRVRVVQMDNLKGLLGVKRMDRVPNAQIRELCGVKKRLDERSDEGMLRWFGHVERMERDKIAKKVFIGVCAGTRSVGRPRKRWIDNMKECLRKRGLGVRQARRMVRVCEGVCMGCSPGMNLSP